MLNYSDKTPFGSGFERYEKGKNFGKEPKSLECQRERKEEKDYFNYLRQSLRKMKEGGIDAHFGQIDVDCLSNQALNFLRLFKKGELEERKLDEYCSQLDPGDNEYQFMAMLRNWLLERKGMTAEKSKEKLKQQTQQKIRELKKSHPYVAARLDNVDLDCLRRIDLKIIQELNPQSLDDYTENLKRYFKNKVPGQNMQDTEALEIIRKDPRFRYYQALCEILGANPSGPENFLS